MAMELDPREAEFQAQIEALRKHFLGELPERRGLLVAAWADCVDAGDEGPWRRLRDVAHRLSGSAPNYGLDAVGDTARALDRLLSGKPPCRERAQAAPAVAALTSSLDSAIAGA